MFTSPHLHRYTERIRIDGREIPRRDVVRLFRALDGHVARGDIPWLTFFELTTIMAFKWFSEQGVDMAVVEVGIGGRLDATNVIDPLAAAITSISLEHTHVLGRTIAAIAGEKAGILKPGLPVVLGRLPAAATRIIEGTARDLGCPVWRPGREYEAVDRGGGLFDYRSGSTVIEGLRTRLGGGHQVGNAAVAATLALILDGRGYPLDEERLRATLRTVRWPGRLERVAGDPETIMDCAHNPEGVRSLVTALRGRRFHVVFGGMSDKPLGDMIRLLAPLTTRLYVTAPDAERALAVRDYPRSVRAVRVPAVADAVDRARADARRAGSAVLVTGSIFTVSEARSRILGLRNTDPIITS